MSEARPDEIEEPDGPAVGEAFTPAVYRIDLSLSPSERYKDLASDFAPPLQGLKNVAVSIAQQILPKSWSVDRVFGVIKLLLRRVYHREETEEIKGIAAASGVELYLLVAFNVLLDVMMGCSSGGIRVSDGRRKPGTSRILHYRTLDWGMDELRDLIVQLDYVTSADGPVVARAITYAGYVGVLTGVKPGLSVSLNYRCTHDDSSTWGIVKLRLHQAAVLFGLRPSLPSVLREALFGTDKSYEQIIKAVDATRSTIAYLVFSNGQHVTILEKDYGPATRFDSDSFLAVTNHDQRDEKPRADAEGEATSSEERPQPTSFVDIMDKVIVGESVSRKEAMAQKYRSCRTVRRGSTSEPTLANVIDWTGTWPITNELTHYSAVMDPSTGDFISAVSWPEPARPSWKKPRNALHRGWSRGEDSGAA